MKRQEQKYLINAFEFSRVLKKFKLFKRYKSRVINSIYFDNKEFKNFFDGEEGTVPRKKVRFRFYENIKISVQRGGVDDTGFGRQITSILGSQNRLDKVKSIKAPTLIIHGLEDPLIKVKNAYKTHKLIEGSILKIIPDMRHLIEPPVFNQFKDDLLEHLNK